jgi:hypothetical protein
LQKAERLQNKAAARRFPVLKPNNRPSGAPLRHDSGRALCRVGRLRLPRGRREWLAVAVDLGHDWRLHCKTWA